MKDETWNPPEDWREYLKNSAESLRTMRLVWREFLGTGSERWARRMTILIGVSTVFGMVQPWLLRSILDGLAVRTLRPLYVGFAGMFLLMIGQRIADHYAMRAREWVFGSNMEQLDKRTSDLFFEKSMGQHIQENSLLNIGNMEKGRNAVIHITGMLVFEGIPSLFQLAISMLLIWLLSPVAASILTALLFAYILWAIFINQRVMQVCTPIDRELRKINRHRVERWDKVERVKTSGKEKEEVHEMRRWFNETIAKDRKFWFWVIDAIFMRGIAKSIASVAVMSYGAWRVWQGDWTLGLLYPLYVWSAYVADNIWHIGQIEHQLNWNLPAISSMVSALTIPPDIVDRPNATNLGHAEPLHVAFQGVSHAYPAGTEEEHSERDDRFLPVLKNVNFDIKPGEKVALMGPSGAGKTTIMRLIQRHMDPTEGAIVVNGVDLREIQCHAWTSLLGYIPQHAQVFDGTIRYNLLYGLPPEARAAVSDDELWAIMRRLQIDFGDRLVNGLDTVVGRNGIKLSGGQAQRLMIGAAVIRKPRLMVIDEATSSLDSTTEKAVQRGLEEVLRTGVSALIVTHRLSTVRHICTKFVVLGQNPALVNGNGQIEAIAGSFEELHGVSPTFRELARDQGVAIG